LCRYFHWIGNYIVKFSRGFNIVRYKNNIKMTNLLKTLLFIFGIIGFAIFIEYLILFVLSFLNMIYGVIDEKE